MSPRFEETLWELFGFVVIAGLVYACTAELVLS